MKRFAIALSLSVAVLGGPVRGEEGPTAESAKPRVEARESQEAMTPNAALERLRAGN